MSNSYRYKITVEYDGGRFHGWQRQSHPVTGELITVQGTIETAIFKITAQHVLVEGAGRTDTGVHAKGQVGHFDLAQHFPALRLRDALNFYLREKGISILTVEEIDNTFHARFSAISRTYKYYIVNRRAPLALDPLRAWHVIPSLNVKAMQEAAKELVGHYDFSAFRAAECQGKSPLKTLSLFEIETEGDKITATIQSKSFLHHQVRIMMGTLKRVGEGKWTHEDVIRIRDEKQRHQAGPTAPAYGLYLVDVGY